MQSKPFSFEGSGGVRLYADHWLPDGEVRGVVQIVHGMAEHGSRYEHVAQAQTGAGFVVYAQHLRGHGKSAASEALKGHFADSNGWDKVLEDVHQVNRLARQQFPDVPLAVLGHSMGSFITQEYLIRHGETVNGAALSASDDNPGALRYAGMLVAWLERLRLGKTGRSELLRKLTFGAFNKPFEPGRTEFDWISSDTDAVDRYLADPGCGYLCSTQLWLELFTALGETAKQSRRRSLPKDLPIYLIAGDQDPACRNAVGTRALAAAYRNAGLRDVELRVYAGGRHEMFNEINQRQVIDDLVTWLTGRLN